MVETRRSLSNLWGAFAALCIIVSVLPLSAQSVKVDAPREHVAGDSFTVTYTVNTSEPVEIIKDPTFSGLELLYGPAIGSRHSMTNINGRVHSTSSTEITYTLMSDRVGRYSISGLRLSLGGKEVSGQTVTVQIRAGESGRTDTRGRRRHASESLEQAEYRYQAIVPRRSVYVQEALPVVYKLLSTEEPRISDTKPSTYDGFVSLDLLGSSQRQLKIERIDGRDWASIEIMKELLFAQHAGQLTIPVNELPILYTLRDPDDPFMNQTSERILRTDPITIQVKPLPEEGKPEDFSGAVGSFKVRYELDSKEWRTHEATTLKIVLEGQGNLKIATLPKLELPADIEIYDPVEKSEQTYEGGILRSKRVLEYSLIPRSTGEIQIPRLAIAYFNPASAKYQTTIAEPISIRITQGHARSVETTVHTHRDNQEEQASSELLSAEAGERTFQSHLALMALIHVLMVALGFCTFLFLKRRRSMRADTVKFAASRAHVMVVKRLKQAHQHLLSNAREAFLEELLRAIWSYLSDKLSIPTSKLSREMVSDELRKKHMDEQSITQLTELIDAIEFARFAPGNLSESLSTLYDKAVQAITAIEHQKNQ